MNRLILAADYPFLDVLWHMVIFFMFVAWIWILISVLTDVFRRHNISGWLKAGWVVFLLVLPFLGVLIYLIAQGQQMAQRSRKETEAAQARFDEYVRQAAGGGGPGAEIERAQQLLDKGAISNEEFQAIKTRALA